MYGLIRPGAKVFQKNSYKQWSGEIGKNPYIIFDIQWIENSNGNNYWLCISDNYGSLLPEKHGDGPIFVTNKDDIIIFEKEFCIHYKNIDYGIECAARNCPCDIFQHKNLFSK